MRKLALVAVAAVAAFAGARTAQSQQKPLPNQIAFVDIERVMQDYRRRQAVVQEGEKRRDALTQQFRQRRTEIEANRDRLATLTEGSEEFLRLQRQVDIDMLTYKRDQEYEEQKLLREQNQKTGLVYREVCNEARVQAEQAGFAAVLAYDPLPAGFENRMNTLSVIQNRDVLWSDPRLDVTQKVIDALNSQLPPVQPPAPNPPPQPGQPGGQK